MKDKIIAALREKYKSKGFSEEALAKVAAYLEKTTTEEAQIDTSVAGVEELLTGFQGEIDKRVNAAVAKAKEKPADPSPDPKPANPQPAGDGDTPAWAKSLVETAKALADKVAALEAGKTVESRKSQLEAKLKDAPEAFKTATLKAYGRMAFADDTAFSEYLTEVETDVKTAVQEEANRGLGGMGKPNRGSSSATGKATKEEVSTIVDGIV